MKRWCIWANIVFYPAVYNDVFVCVTCYLCSGSDVSSRNEPTRKTALIVSAGCVVTRTLFQATAETQLLSRGKVRRPPRYETSRKSVKKRTTLAAEKARLIGMDYGRHACHIKAWNTV